MSVIVYPTYNNGIEYSYQVDLCNCFVIFNNSAYLLKESFQVLL